MRLCLITLAVPNSIWILGQLPQLFFKHPHEFRHAVVVLPLLVRVQLLSNSGNLLLRRTFFCFLLNFLRYLVHLLIHLALQVLHHLASTRHLPHYTHMPHPT